MQCLAQHITTLTSLKTLNLKETTLQQDDGVALGELMCRLPHLEVLDVTENEAHTDHDLASAAVAALTPSINSVPKLQSLNSAAMSYTPAQHSLCAPACSVLQS